MARIVSSTLIGLTLSMYILVSSEGNMGVIFRRIRRIDRDILNIRNTLSSNIDFAIASLKSEVYPQIEEQVQEAMDDILEDESPDEMVRSDAVSEMRKLKHGHHQMKRELIHVMTSLREVEGDRTCIGCPHYAHRNGSEVTTCSKRLKMDLVQCTGRQSHSRRETKKLKHSLGILNKTCHLQPQITNVETSPQNPTTTEKPYEGSRIILAPYYSNTRQQFHQLNIDSDTLKTYPHLNRSFIMSLTYSSKLRKLFICLLYPSRIISTNLDMQDVKTVKEGVQPLGMAIDEDRQEMFMTIETPEKAVARMETSGKNFFPFRGPEWYKYSYPWAIALNPKEEKKYVCDRNKVLVSTYYGHSMQVLAEGSSIYALTLDINRGILYYGDDQKLMGLSLSENRTVVVSHVGSRIFNLVYHNSTVYFSRYSDTWVSSTTLGKVDVGYASTTFKSTDVGFLNVTYKSYPVDITNILGLSMCLVN